MIPKRLVVSAFQTNCYILGCSITQKALVIDPGDGVEVYPGHGPETTIGRERKHNPFLNS